MLYLSKLTHRPISDYDMDFFSYHRMIVITRTAADTHCVRVFIQVNTLIVTAT